MELSAAFLDAIAITKMGLFVFQAETSKFLFKKMNLIIIYSDWKLMLFTNGKGVFWMVKMDMSNH